MTSAELDQQICFTQLACYKEWATKTSVIMQVTPALAEPVEPAALRAQTNAEARRDMEAMAGFGGRLKEWWQDFSHDALSRRQEGSLRLTCMGEDGLLRPCCAFVKPLQLGRLAADLRTLSPGCRLWRLLL